jgi:hypothetical protein
MKPSVYLGKRPRIATRRLALFRGLSRILRGLSGRRRDRPRAAAGAPRPRPGGTR